jgi:hypothetical protein
MRKFSVLALTTILSIVGEQVILPVSAQQPATPNQTAQADALLPPRIERVPTPTTRLHMGMPEAEVERTMGAATEVATSESSGANVRVLKYRLSPIPAKITICDGRVSAIALDIAAADDRELPTFSRSVWLGMHRAVVLQMLGAPAEDHVRESFGMKLEHMIFARAGQPDLTVVLIDDRVATRKAGRELPPDIFSFSLPLATNEADPGIERPRSTRIRLGMSMGDAQALFGAPKHSVSYTFKGQPADYRIYETGPNGSFARFDFIDDVLVGFSDGGKTPLEQILSGG